jgi:hypothetical protein
MVSAVASIKPQDCLCKDGYQGNYTVGCYPATTTTNTVASTGTPTTTTPIPVDRAKKVEYKATISMTAAQFDTNKRTAYIAATALYLSVPVEHVSIGAVREKKKVAYKVTLAMTAAQFTTSKRTAYIAATARSLSVPVTDVSIETVTEVIRGRKLLATEIVVETIITVSPDVADPVATANAIALAASSETITIELASIDITATSADQPVITSTSEIETIITVPPDVVNTQATVDEIILAASSEGITIALDVANITATSIAIQAEGTITTSVQSVTTVSATDATTTTPTETTTTTPAPLEPGTVAVISFAMIVEMALTDFEGETRAKFVRSVADALGVDSFNIEITSITEKQGRRLLAPSLDVGIAASVPSDIAESVGNAVSAENLGAVLLANNFVVSGVSAPVVSFVAPKSLRDVTQSEKQLISRLFLPKACHCRV